MKRPEQTPLLRIFPGGSDRHDGRPRFEAIVLAAFAGADAGAHPPVRGTPGSMQRRGDGAVY